MSKKTGAINIEKLSRADFARLRVMQSVLAKFQEELHKMTVLYEGPTCTDLDLASLQLADARSSLRQAMGLKSQEEILKKFDSESKAE
jgi:hypothetical protein